MSKKFNREKARKEIFKKSLRGKNKTLGLFNYTPYSVGDDSLFRNRIRYFNDLYS